MRIGGGTTGGSIRRTDGLKNFLNLAFMAFNVGLVAPVLEFSLFEFGATSPCVARMSRPPDEGVVVVSLFLNKVPRLARRIGFLGILGY